ncbi:MAG: DNA-3-methyladenine glycosylase 2 family protein [Cyanobacteria bacterium J06632_22]
MGQTMELAAEVCYRALSTRDARFDGRFFTGVRSTGIFCRPICPARLPKFENCEFFNNAAQAQQAGYRPCLRCHPELSPRLFQQVGTEVTVARALRLIAQGALDQGSVADLAARLGVSDRRLRQLFATHVGTSPGQAALSRRILFAKQLIHQTDLSLTEIAIAAGFNSLRRFNDAIRKACGHPPSDWRRPGRPHQDGALRLRLAYSPPYDWAAMMAYWQPRLMAGVETIQGMTYRRVIQVGGQTGWVQVQPATSGHALQAEIHLDAVEHLSGVVERLRRMFDLETDSAAIAAHLQADETLQPLVERRPGLRLPGCWDPFELTVRVILGQQVSVAAATTLCNRLIERYGTPVTHSSPQLDRCFPGPQQLMAADLTTIGITRTRVTAIRALATAMVETPNFLSQLQSVDQVLTTLCQLPGVGPWTAQYVALRGLQLPDAFPSGDLGLLRAMAALETPLTQTELVQRAEAWRPWRAYAALYLWTADVTTPQRERAVTAPTPLAPHSEAQTA